ncbi:MAG: hypothetical protein E7043_10000 [Lentisphaerae bacterium]|nr:hypothetical protein [Lentisphaerota bacterium]MBE6395333.1 hypothetical protein [Lentisphaerota bacterium]
MPINRIAPLATGSDLYGSLRKFAEVCGRLLLSPEIIHVVLTGQLDQIGVEKCKQPFPVLWDEQKKFFGIE